MGACLCKGHKELHHAMTTLQNQTVEGQPAPVKDNEGSTYIQYHAAPKVFCGLRKIPHPSKGKEDGQTPSNGSVADKANHYDIGELATSSLMGLVATIKEHITKPTAMAQGRVAHLIEWKGWGGGGEAGGGKGSWRGGWGGMGAELHQDEQFYSQMTDEIKEARFAAGVAEQFALAEAAMNMWSMNDGFEQPSTSKQAQSHFLSHFLLDGGSVGVPHHLYNIHAQNYGNVGVSSLVPTPATASVSLTPSAQQESNPPSEEKRTVTAEAAVRHVDSSSLSEDDVFYN